MFSHVVLGTDDLPAARRFYDAITGTLGIPPAVMDVSNRFAYAHDGGLLIITLPIDGAPATVANGGTTGFKAADPATVDAWVAAGTAAGGTLVETPPGRRESPFGPLYAAYMRDPAGNKLCAATRLKD